METPQWPGKLWLNQLMKSKFGFSIVICDLNLILQSILSARIFKSFFECRIWKPNIFHKKGCYVIPDNQKTRQQTPRKNIPKQFLARACGKIKIDWCSRVNILSRLTVSSMNKLDPVFRLTQTSKGFLRVPFSFWVAKRSNPPPPSVSGTPDGISEKLHFPTCNCDWDLELAFFSFY